MNYFGLKFLVIFIFVTENRGDRFEGPAGPLYRNVVPKAQPDCYILGEAKCSDKIGFCDVMKNQSKCVTCKPCKEKFLCKVIERPEHFNPVNFNKDKTINVTKSSDKRDTYTLVQTTNTEEVIYEPPEGRSDENKTTTRAAAVTPVVPTTSSVNITQIVPTTPPVMTTTQPTTTQSVVTNTTQPTTTQSVVTNTTQVTITLPTLSEEDQIKVITNTTRIINATSVSASVGDEVAASLDHVITSIALKPSSRSALVLNLIRSLSEKVEVNARGEFLAIQNNFESKVVELPLETLLESGVSYNPNSTDAVTKISLPPAVFQQVQKQLSSQQNKRRKKREIVNVRIHFQYYNDDTLFPSEQSLSSHIIAASIGGGITIEKLEDPIKISHINQSLKDEKENINKYQDKKSYKECVFWDGNDWNKDGCCLVTNVDPHECHCDHLTNFALLVKNDVVASTPILSVVSDIGCYISILCLFITTLVYVTNRKAMKMRATKIFLNIVINMSISLIFFVAGINKTDDQAGCLAITLLLHYFLLVTWFWKTAYSYEVYLSLVKVFNTSREKYLQKLALVCYLSPFLIVLLTASIAIGGVDYTKAHRYCGGIEYILEDSSYMSENMCWLHGGSLNFGFLLPIAVLLLSNIAMFVAVLRELHKKKGTHSADTKIVSDNLLLSITMALTMGVAWIFAYLILISDNEIFFVVTSWIFAVTCGFQGFLIFIFSVVRRSHLWMHLFEEGGFFGFLRKSSSINLHQKNNYSSQHTEMTLGSVKVRSKSISSSKPTPVKSST